MANREIHDTPYGQFGRARYSKDGEGWSFERQLGSSLVLRPVGEPRVINPPNVDQSQSRSHLNNEYPTARRRKQVQELIQAFPDVQPAHDILPDLARVSEAVDQNASRFDPNQGDLLAIGRIPDESLKTSTLVFAAPSGPSGSDLSLIECRASDRGWHDSKTAFLKVMSASGERAVWRGPGVPIQQVVFAQPYERGDCLLAVRLMTSVVLFKPIVRQTSGQSSKGSHTGFSRRLELNFLLDITIEDAGHVPFTDVAFNPWFTRQFAITDAVGQWSVWELEGRERRAVKRIYRGTIETAEDMHRESRAADGWVRIAWVANPTTLVVCTRHGLGVVELSAKMPMDISLIATSVTPDWILSMIPIPFHPALFAILTPIHLSVFQFEGNRLNETPARKVSSIRHFIDPQDASLTMSAVADGTVSQLLIYSRISATVIAYRLTRTQEDLVTLSDAVELRIGALAGLHGVHVDQIGISSKAEGSACLASRYNHKGIKFFNVTMLEKDMALQQRLYFGTQTDTMDGDVQDLSWERRAKFIKSSAVLVDDSFIVDDNEDATAEPASTPLRPISEYKQKWVEGAVNVDRQDWTVSFDRTVHQLSETGIESFTALDEVLEEINHLRQFSPPDTLSPPFSTLRELARTEITLRDVDEASKDLRALQLEEVRVQKKASDHAPYDETTSSDLVVRSICWQRDIDGIGGKDCATVYKSVLDQWVGPLPSDMGDHLRSSREYLARQMAAEIALSGLLLQPTTIVTEQEPGGQQAADTESQLWQLPFRPVDLNNPNEDPGIASQLASALPTPSPSASASVVTGPGEVSSSGTPGFHRLSKFTTFSKPLPFTQPRFQRRILSHWNPGSDPSTYDWFRASRNVTRGDEEEGNEGEEMTERERLAMQRRAERHLRRQRREAEESQRQQILRSQIPEILSASQPRETLRPLRERSHQASSSSRHLIPSSSQTVGSSQVPATQILPGRHGGRPPARKKRKSGF